MLTLQDIAVMQARFDHEHEAYMKRHEDYMENRAKVLKVVELARTALLARGGEVQ